VIVFKRPAGQPGPDVLLKRVIGLPGDTVEVNMGRPVINGWKVPHCDAGLFVYLGGVETVRGRLAVEFLDDNAYLTVLEPDAGPFAPHKLGPGDLFVLGDARGRSIDSRNLNEGRGGDIPSSAVLGRSSRILFEARHDGRIDWGRVWTEIGREAHMHGVDVSELREGVEKCLRKPPASRPPRATLTSL
jgi:signal peptidase I